MSSEKKQNKGKFSGSVFLTQIRRQKEVKQNQDSHEQTNTVGQDSIFKHFSKGSTQESGELLVAKTVTKKFPILGILGGLAFLFLLFVVLLVVVLAFGDVNSSLLVAFNIDESKLKEILLFILNASFGSVAFIVLLVFVIGLFRFSLAKKENKLKRKGLLKQIFVSLSFLIIMLLLWFGSFSIVQSIKLPIPLDQLKIKTIPEDVTDLEAPVEIEFDVNSLVQALADRGFFAQSADWDFDGNGDFEYHTEEATVKRLFEQEGNITVTVRFNFESDEPKTFSKVLNIQNATFYTDVSEGFAPLTVAFDATVLERKEQPAISFDWDFDGDKEYDFSEIKPTVEYTFDKIGEYNVSLRVIDLNNTVRNYQKKIKVLKDLNPKIEAKIHVLPDVKGEAPLKLSFDGGESTSLEGGIKKYEWDFADGSELQFGRKVTHEYKNPGIYEMGLMIYNEKGETDYASQEIEVIKSLSAPEAVITTKPDFDETTFSLEGVAPFHVLFDASASHDKDDNIVEYAWDFDSDGKADSYGQIAEYSFEKEGTFTTKLLVIDQDEQQSTMEISVKVKQRELQAILNAEPLSGQMPLKVNFDASESVYKKGEIVSYEWNFGEQEQSEYGSAKKVHIYDKIGRYKVSVKVYTDDGKSAETTKEVFVTPVQLQACFSVNRYDGSAPLTVKFDSSCSKGEIAKWKWDFGDGFISTGYVPTHTFNQPGEFTVVLELIDAKNNSSTFERVIKVKD